MATINTITFQVTTDSNTVDIAIPDFLIEEFGRTLIWPGMPHLVKMISPEDATKSITTDLVS
jgi:hypothetical protein